MKLLANFRFAAPDLEHGEDLAALARLRELRDVGRDARGHEPVAGAGEEAADLG